MTPPNAALAVVADARAASPWMPDDGLKTETLAELLASPIQKREHLVAPWLRQGESAMIWSAPGVGKTWLTLTLGLMVAGGGGALGWRGGSPVRSS